jgi:hypothetical protein
MSLIDYYDNVALEGLKLARNDAMRGVLMPEQLKRINESLVDIVENLEIADGLPDRLMRVDPVDTASALLASASADLSERHDNPVSARSDERPDSEKTSVLCVPGRGAFDEVTTSIAVQLLGRQGLAPMMATHSGYRSARPDEPSFKDTPIISIISLDAPDSPPYLRNMLRRTREWRPHATLVVGVGGTPEDDGAELGATGASHAAPTFRALIEECQAAANVQHARQVSHGGGGG